MKSYLTDTVHLLQLSQINVASIVNNCGAIICCEWLLNIFIGLVASSHCFGSVGMTVAYRTSALHLNIQARTLERLRFVVSLDVHCDGHHIIRLTEGLKPAMLRYML